MNTKQFEAILAKNEIAREIMDDEPNRGYIVAMLRDIEKFTGQGNQPNIDSLV